MWLVNFSRNWADEFEVYGMMILTDDEKALWEALVRKNSKSSMEVNFGTNEGWEDTIGDFFSDDNYSFISIADYEAAVFKNHFGKSYNDRYEYGHIWHPQDILEELYPDEEEPDEDENE